MAKTEAELVLDRKKREYIPPSRQPSAKDDLNLNPLASRGHLDGASFAATMVALLTFLFISNYLIRGHLQLARVALDFDKAVQFYALWAFISGLGFYMVSVAFFKRWQFILRVEKLGSLTRMMMRLMLLSPLLSIWLTFFTLINGGALRGARFVAAVASLLVFHFAVLGWLIYDGAIVAGPGLTAHLVREKSPDKSLDDLLPLTATRMWLPSENFAVHAMPYLSPLSKFALSLYVDFSRVQALYAETSDPGSPLCQDKLGYLGHPVEDCFFFNYRKVSKAYPFTTPIIAWYFEDLYRKSSISPVVGDQKSETNPISVFAPAMLTMNNLVTLMEFGEGTRSRRAFLHPIGLLRIYSSPEIPMLEFGQDLQRIVLGRKVLPIIRPQLAAIEKQSLKLQSVMSRRQSDDLELELGDLVARMNSIERDPLGIGQSFVEDGVATKAGAPSKE